MRARWDTIETYKIVHEIYDQETSPRLELRKDINGGRRGHSLTIFKT